jgi:hypothetical protein
MQTLYRSESSDTRQPVRVSCPEHGTTLMIPRSRLLKFEQWPDILRHGLTGAGKSMLLHWGSLFSGQSTSTVLVIPEDKAP